MNCEGSTFSKHFGHLGLNSGIFLKECVRLINEHSSRALIALDARSYDIVPMIYTLLRHFR